MKQIFKNYIFPALAGILVGVIIGLLINLPSCQSEPKVIVEYVEKHDTVTIEKERIKEKTKTEYVDRLDTFYIKESGDTVVIDSIPIEHKVYEDTIKNDSTSTEIKIEYSGFNPEIQSVWLKHNYIEKQETIIKEPKKIGIVWSVGPCVGFGGVGNLNNGSIGYGPYIGVSGTIGIGGFIK